MSNEDRIQEALDIAYEWGWIDGGCHKMWIIDQMVRVLCGSDENYRKWVDKYEEPLAGYEDDWVEWDTGIAP